MDYRFTLAAERTFLAWIRTALTLLAGGVAAHELIGNFGIPVVRTAMATATIGLAAIVAAGALLRWRAIDSAIRRDASLPASTLMPVLAVAITILCTLVGIAVAIS
ncbi:YidH family protein [Nocardia goodfellowii]